MNKNKLIPKCSSPAGPIEYVGMPKEEFDWMNHMFWSDPNNPKYKWFLQYAKDKYGRLGDTRLPEVVVEAKRPEKTLAENAKENIEEVKLKWNNLPTDSKLDLALTGAGFIPGLDVAADVYDLGRFIKNGEWGSASLAAFGLALPISGRVLRNASEKTTNLFKNLSKNININKHLNLTNVFDMDYFTKWLSKANSDQIDSYFRRLSDDLWDYLYNTALQRNDLNTVQRIRDAHFRYKFPNSETYDRWYHGTDATFTEFRPDVKNPYNLHYEPFMHVGTLDQAKDFISNDGNVYKLFLNLKNSLFTNDYVHERALDFADELRKRGIMTLDEFDLFRNSHPDRWNERLRNFLSSKGYDGTRYVNEVEGTTKTISRSFIDPSQVKSAEAVTKDDLGNIIPISKRDNPSILDFRYILIPGLASSMLGFQFNDSNENVYKSGGRLIPKHNKGNKVEETFGIDTSKFTKNPSSTKLDSKKVTNPNGQRNKLTKKKHASYINPLFVNTRPTPGFITFPRKKIIESEYKNS